MRNCDKFNDVGDAMIAFFTENPKYGKPDSRMAFSTPLFALAEWMLKDVPDQKIEKHCSNCEFFRRDHSHCVNHDSLTNKAYCCNCWEEKQGKKK